MVYDTRVVYGRWVMVQQAWLPILYLRSAEEGKSQFSHERMVLLRASPLILHTQA